MADRLTGDEVRVFEGSKLLKDPGPARPEAFGELVRGARAVETEPKQEVSSKVRWALRSAPHERPESDVGGGR
jgi:hypothetical protein